MTPLRLAAACAAATLSLSIDPSYTQYASLNECSDAYSFSQTFSLQPAGAVTQVALTPNDGLRLCLTSANASTGAYLSLAFAPCAGGPAQSWSLDAAGALSGPQGAVAAAAPASGGPWWWGQPLAVRGAGAGDAWSLTGGGALVHKPSGLCLDAGPLPNAHGCLDAAVRGLPFCDASLPVADRVADLLGRLTLAEKIALTGSGPYADDCDLTDVGVPRLDVRPHMWLVETNSMVASQCYGATCATLWPSGNNLAATFNRTVFSLKGAVLGDEMRALNNLGWHRADTQSSTRVGLNGFGPDINQPRDPRNGRAGELASEDPFLIGSYAVGMVRGAQEDAAYPATLKMSLGVKHYAGYSMETGRMTSVGSFSFFDLMDTYLVPYEMAFADGGATGSMCSYISLGITLNGSSFPAPASFVPACANAYLLSTLVRQYWGRPDAVHTSDCGAVKNMASPRLGAPYAANLTAAAADAVNAGMDLNTETTVPSHLADALAAGLTTEAALDASLSRTLSLRVRLGLLDPLEAQPLTRLGNFGAATVGAPAHRAAALDAAAQSLVLLKNGAGALPLKRGARLAVLGPMAAADRALLGDYYADAVCPGGSDNQKGDFSCVPTIAASLAQFAGAVVNFTGVTVSGNDSSWGAALAAASAADAVVLCLGADGTIGAEGTDVADISLPGVQAEFGLAVLAAAAAAATPVIFVLVSPFPTAFDPLAAGAHAIILAGTPGFGAPALARAMFGENRWGRVSQSIYPAAYQHAVALGDFSMVPRTQPLPNAGRGYRYYNGGAGALLARFGEGLTYSSGVALACGGGLQADDLVLACNISCGSPGGDQVLTVFHRVSPDIVARIAGAHPVPLLTLVAFDRVAVPAGATVAVQLRAPAARALALVEATGASVIYPGLHFFDVWDGAANNVTVAVQSPTADTLVVKRPPLPDA